MSCLSGSSARTVCTPAHWAAHTPPAFFDAVASVRKTATVSEGRVTLSSRVLHPLLSLCPCTWHTVLSSSFHVESSASVYRKPSLLVVHGCWPRGVISFTGTATGNLSTLQSITLPPTHTLILMQATLIQFSGSQKSTATKRHEIGEGLAGKRQGFSRNGRGTRG